MKKNVAGQKIGAQMITAADGSVFAGAVTVYVTGDAGTQAVGSVGAGACTHEGNGYHTYAPAQAETNYGLIAFTFIGTGAVAATVQIYPSFPQTVDLSTGITAGTIANVTTVNGLAANVITAASMAADASAEIADQVWDELLAGHAGVGSTGAALSAAGGSGDPWATALPGAYGAGTAGQIVGDYLDVAVSSVSGLDAAGVRAAVGLASANLDTQLVAIDDFLDTEVAAIKAKTDNLPASPAAVSDIPTATQNADALLNRDMSAVSDTNARSPLNALRFLRNKWSLSGTALTVTKENDSTTAWTAVVTAAPGADPISGNDPA